jgi:hypothetical protein
MESNGFVPTIAVTPDKLPSKGKCYPDGVQIRYRGYLFGEVQQINASKGNSFIDMLKNSMAGVEVTGMQKEVITLPDAMYLSILRKLSTVGSNEFKLKYACRHCAEINERVFTQMELQFNDLEVDATSVAVTLSNGVEYVFSPLTFGDTVRLAEGKISSLKKGNLLSDRTANYAAMCRNLTFDKAYTSLFNISSQDDFEILEEIDKLFRHDLKPLIGKCAKCEKENSLVLEGRDSLITPFRAGGETARDKLRLIKRPASEPVSN